MPRMDRPSRRKRRLLVVAAVTTTAEAWLGPIPFARRAQRSAVPRLSRAPLRTEDRGKHGRLRAMGVALYAAASSSRPSSSPQYEPAVPVAINGGDPWVGWRVTSEELQELSEAATSTVKGKPVMKQFHPRRSWLWKQWNGTIVRSVLLNEVKLNVLWAIVAVSVVWHLAPRAVLMHQSLGMVDATGVSLEACRAAVVASLKPMENFWALTQTLVAFVLSFFLSQTYAVWREIYSIARKVQGRLSDLGLILATNAQRDLSQPHTPYTPSALVVLETWARYARLFNMLFFASVTRRFAPLATPKGLQALQTQGAITTDEVAVLMETTSWHQTVALWMSTVVSSSIHGGVIGGGNGMAYQTSIVMTQLRSHYAQMGDALSGRMNLAYTHLVQLFVDMLCLAAPLALVGPLGAAGAVAGTAAVTLFYTGVLALAKMFLDPFDNEDYGGRSGIRLEADTLVQEVNALTRRWTTAARDVPKAVVDPVASALAAQHHHLGLPVPAEFSSSNKKPQGLTKDDTTVLDVEEIDDDDDDDLFFEGSGSGSPDDDDDDGSGLGSFSGKTTGSTTIPRQPARGGSTEQMVGPNVVRASWRDVDDLGTALRAVDPRSEADIFDDDAASQKAKKPTLTYTNFSYFPMAGVPPIPKPDPTKQKSTNTDDDLAGPVDDPNDRDSPFIRRRVPRLKPSFKLLKRRPPPAQKDGSSEQGDAHAEVSR